MKLRTLRKAARAPNAACSCSWWAFPSQHSMRMVATRHEACQDPKSSPSDGAALYPGLRAVNREVDATPAPPPQLGRAAAAAGCWVVLSPCPLHGSCQLLQCRSMWTLIDALQCPHQGQACIGTAQAGPD